MAQATNGDTVRVHYSGRLKDGTEFDSSSGGDPLEFTVGEHKLIPDFEATVVGMAVGDNATVDIAAENAYGPRRPDAIQSVERSMIPEDVDLSIGNQLQASGTDGQVIVLTVLEADDATVTLDGNHPLAGEDLTFDIELVEIVAAGE